MAEIDLQAIASRRIVYEIAGDVVRREVHAYRADDGSTQPMDVYYPAAVRKPGASPAVVMVSGYPDGGMRRIFGRNAKDIGSNVSWAQLMAASGLAVVTYVNVNPVEDAAAVVRHLSQNASGLGIDGERLGIWSCSGNVPNALGLLMGDGPHVIKCAALLYGYMLDLEGSTIVKDMSRFGYVTPGDGRSVDDMPDGLPLFIARAGLDETPRLNETIDMFVRHALARNLPMTLVNHRTGHHAFDAVDDTAQTRAVIRQIVAFLVDRLIAPHE